MPPPLRTFIYACQDFGLVCPPPPPHTARLSKTKLNDWTRIRPWVVYVCWQTSFLLITLKKLLYSSTVLCFILFYAVSLKNRCVIRTKSELCSRSLISMINSLHFPFSSHYRNRRTLRLQFIYLWSLSDVTWVFFFRLIMKKKTNLSIIKYFFEVFRSFINIIGSYNTCKYTLYITRFFFS